MEVHQHEAAHRQALPSESGHYHQSAAAAHNALLDAQHSQAPQSKSDQGLPADLTARGHAGNQPQSRPLHD